jgi:hypothetical protein
MVAPGLGDETARLFPLELDPPAQLAHVPAQVPAPRGISQPPLHFQEPGEGNDFRTNHGLRPVRKSKRIILQCGGDLQPCGVPATTRITMPNLTLCTRLDRSRIAWTCFLEKRLSRPSEWSVLGWERCSAPRLSLRHPDGCGPFAGLGIVGAGAVLPDADVVPPVESMTPTRALQLTELSPG